MIQIEEKKNCCGCGACVAKCPKHCIELIDDNEGFWYPQIKNNSCIQCNLCIKSCPILQEKKEVEVKPKQSLIAYAKSDKIRLASSSGGLFSLFAKTIIESNGIVIGAAFDEKFMVHHIPISSEEELEKLQGSKYLQSRIEDTYQIAEKNLLIGKSVLFSGTACQIAGLKNYLQKDYLNLYTIDVLCHGVPSPKVWKKYLLEQENIHDAVVQKVSFRQKNKGWKMFSLSLGFTNKKTYSQVYKKDLFMRMFLNDICLRPSCHNCKFKSISRHSDITLGDCWGIEKHSAEMDDDRGASIVLVHSQKGTELFKKVIEELEVKEMDVDIILPATADSRKSVEAHPNRNKFFRYLNQDKSIFELENLIKPPLLYRARQKAKKIFEN